MLSFQENMAELLSHQKKSKEKNWKTHAFEQEQKLNAMFFD